MAENTAKKADYKELSDQRCPDCGRPLKQNKVDRKHKYCYVCFKLRNGKRFYFKDEVKLDRLVLQKANQNTYLKQKI